MTLPQIIVEGLAVSFESHNFARLADCASTYKRVQTPRAATACRKQSRNASSPW
jgi:hypothetical protein